MVDPQVETISDAIQNQVEQRDFRGIAVLGGVGALGVLGIREIIDRLDGTAGITASPASVRDHVMNGVAKVLIAGLIVIAAQRSGMGGQIMAFAAVFAFGALVSAGGNALDAIGRTRFAAELQQAATQRGSPRATRSARSHQVRRAPSRNGGRQRQGVTA